MAGTSGLVKRERTFISVGVAEPDAAAAKQRKKAKEGKAAQAK
jgi:hypothetical protein